MHGNYCVTDIGDHEKEEEAEYQMKNRNGKSLEIFSYSPFLLLFFFFLLILEHFHPFRNG
jgi:hypothetical protein